VSTKDLSEACDIKHHHLASKLRHGGGQSRNIYRTAQNQIVITLEYRDCGTARIAYGAETIAYAID
jgi:hypothetical protein